MLTGTQIAHWGSVLTTGRIVLFVTTFGSLLGLFSSPSSSLVKNAFHSLASLCACTSFDSHCCDVVHVGSLCGELHLTYRHWAFRAELQMQHTVDPQYYESSPHIQCALTHQKSSLTFVAFEKNFHDSNTKLCMIPVLPTPSLPLFLVCPLFCTAL